MLFIGEGLLVLLFPLRRGEGERGEIERRGLEGDLERESTERGVRERVRSRPREAERDGIAMSGFCDTICDALNST